MKKLAIRAERLSKQYGISSVRYRHDTLRDQIVAGVKSVFRNSRWPEEKNGAFWALRDVSFDVKQGEVIGLIGRNGAGKSTLFKILSRITEPTTGRAEICGRIGSLLEVGTGFDRELSGRENVFLNGAILGMRSAEIKRKFEEIVAFSEVEKFIDTPVKRYSSGMYMRLAFSVAAHLETEILLVDEVLAVGDASFQKKCLGKMGEVAKEGRTVFLVSHNMVAINSMCSRVIWVDSGEIKEDGPTAQVVSKYLAESVKCKDLYEELWEEASTAPGNDTVRLHRVRVRLQGDSPSDPLTMQTPFLIEVEYWNLVAEAKLHITLHLYTEQEIIAFTTGSVFEPVWSDRPLPVGLFRSVCYVPGELLNSGRHHFAVLVVKDKSTVTFKYESGVSFDILDLRERQGAWYGKEAGVVQPVLKWETEYLDSDSGIKNQGNQVLG